VKNPHISKTGQPSNTKLSAPLRITNAAWWVVWQHCITNLRWRPTHIGF